MNHLRVRSCGAGQMALWTSGFVVLTLVVNAPLVPWLLRMTGVAESGVVKRRMRAKAARALVHYTHSAIDDLKQDEDEMLRGARFEITSRAPGAPARRCLHPLQQYECGQWQSMT